MEFEDRVKQVADQVIALPEVTLVTDRAAKKIAAALPPLPLIVDETTLRRTIEELDAANEIAVFDLDGEIAIEA